MNGRLAIQLIASMLLAVGLLTSCANRYSNLIEVPGPNRECLVIIKKQWNDRLAYLDPDGEFTPLEFTTDCLGTIESILWSPSGKYVLIESYGEGDQAISVYEFDRLVWAEQHRHELVDDCLPAYRILDPYLHSLQHIKWTEDGEITFRSIGDFTHFDRDLRRATLVRGDADDVDMENTEREWRWDLKQDVFLIGKH